MAFFNSIAELIGGTLKAGSTIVEATSGNTGFALAYIGAGFVPKVLDTSVIGGGI